jgi:hypothetical protein
MMIHTSFFFNDGDFCIFKASYVDDSWSVSAMEQDNYNIIPSHSNFDDLYFLGIITEEEYNTFVLSFEEYIAKDQLEREAKKEKEEIETLIKLRAKYPNL